MAGENMSQSISAIIVNSSREKTLSFLNDDEKLKVDVEQTFDEFDKQLQAALNNRLSFLGVPLGGNSENRDDDEVLIFGRNLGETYIAELREIALDLVLELRNRKSDWVKSGSDAN